MESKKQKFLIALERNQGKREEGAVAESVGLTEAETD